METELQSSTDYYPFGQPMPERNFNEVDNRFGFNGKENDNEIAGTGSWQNYGMREYDTRIARFISMDPLIKSYPWYTPYQFAGNKPIKYIDLDGAEEFDPIQDPMLLSRLVKTSFYDIKHAAENILFTVGATITNSPVKYKAQYAVNSTGDQIFETEIVPVIESNGEEAVNFTLDALTVASAGRIDATDALAGRSGTGSQLTRAAKEVGWSSEIMPYKEARKITQGENGVIQAHKIPEKRHARSLPGYVVNDAPSIVLTKEQHQTISNALYKALPKGTKYSPDQIQSAYKNAYAKYPAVQKAASDYINRTK